MSLDEKLELLQTRQTVARMIVMGIVVLIIIQQFLVYNCIKIQEIDSNIASMKRLSDGYTFALDECLYEGDSSPLTRDRFKITGWLIKRGEDTARVTLRIVLNNIDTGECLLLPTTLLQRGDVTSAYDDGHNYDNSGFSVNLPLSVIDFDNVNYSLMALYSLNGEEYLIDLDTDIKKTKRKDE